MSYLDIAAAAVVMAVLSRLLLHNIIKMLGNTDKRICTMENYRGKAIPAIGGVAFIPILLTGVLLLLLFDMRYSQSYLSYLLLVLAVGFTGLLDDIIGDTKVKGLINHVKSTLAGKMTTGFLKALTGVLISCIVSFGISASYMEFMINALIIALSANTLNLFDLRPGRAVKVFLAAALVLLATTAGSLPAIMPLALLNLAAWLYIGYDLREVCMLGDTGANILGISLGYYCALLLGINTKLFVLALLVSLNIITEKLSITELINKSRLFSYLDNLGRERRGNR